MAQSLDALYAEKARLQSVLDNRSATNEDQNTSAIGDTATDIKRGFQQLPGAITGVGDIIPGALFNARPFNALTESIGEATGFQPGRWAEEARQEYSPERVASDQAIADAEGFLDTFATGITEPRAVAGMVAESLPMMLAGGVAGRGLLAAGAIKSAPVAVGAGEGLVSAGMQMEGLGEQGVDPRIAAFASAATGTVVGAIGIGGATLAQKMKLADPDLVVAGLSGAPTTARPAVSATTESLAARMGEAASRMGRGAIQEGLLEEAPQSMAETAITNLSTGQDITEGLGEAAASGLLAGGAMGGAFNIRGRGKPLAQTADEVTKAATDAGFNLDIPSGQQELQTLMQLEGDPVENAIAARKTLSDNFVAFTENAIEKKGNGIGDKRAPKLQAMLDGDGMNSKEGVNAAIKGLRTDVQQEFKNTNHYKNLPATEQEAKLREEMKQEASAVTEATAPVDEPTTTPAGEPVVQEPVAPLTPEAQAEQDNTISELINTGVLTQEDLDNISEEDMQAMITGQREAKADEFTQADLIDDVKPVKETNRDKVTAAVKKATAVKEPVDALFATEEKTEKTLRGVADLITGTSKAMADSSMAKAKTRAKADLTETIKEMKRALPRYFNAKGNARADTPAELKAYLNNLKGSVDTALAMNNGAGNGYVLEALRRSGERLANKYSSDKLRKHVNSIIYGSKRLRNAKAVGPVSRAVRTAMDRLDSKGNPEAASYLHDLFEVFHRVSRNYDQKVKAERDEDVTVGLDFRQEEKGKGADAKNFDERLLKEAAAASNQMLGKDTVFGSRSLPELAGYMNELFASMEDAIGQENLRKALGVAKKKPYKTSEALPGSKKGSDNSETVRFSRFYNQYRNEGEVNTSLNPNRIRRANEEQRRLEKAFDKETNVITLEPGKDLPSTDGRLTSKLEENMRKEAARRKESAPPVILLLDTVRNHSMSPIGRLISGRLQKILSKSNYADKIVVKIHPEARSKTGAVGSFIPTTTDKGQPVLNLWVGGQTEATIIHEAMHAVTVGMVSDFRNGKLKGQALAVMRDLEELRGVTLQLMRKDIDAYEAKKQGRTDEDKLEYDYLNQAFVALTSKAQGLDEFITYAMTKKPLQDWMRRQRVPKAASKQFTAKNVWAVFSSKLRTMFNLNTVGANDVNSLLNQYANAVTAVLGEVDYAGKKNVNVFFYKRPSNLNPRSRLPIYEATADPQNFQGSVTPEQTAEAKRKYDKAQAELRAIKDAEAKKQEAESKKIRATIDEEALARAEGIVATTATEPRQVGPRKGKHNANFLDAVQRRVADSIVKFISPKHDDYEDWANSVLDSAGNYITNLTARDQYLARTLGTMLSKVIDNYGVPSGYRNTMSAFEHKVKGMHNDMFATYENLLTLDTDMQQALLDYIADANKDKLRASIPDENQVDTIIKTVDALETLLARAKREGLIAKENEDKALIDFIDLREGKFRVVNKTSFSQIHPARGDDNIVQVTEGIPLSNVYNKRGEQTKNVAGKKFFYAISPTKNEAYLIEKGADTSVWDALSVGPQHNTPELLYPFTVTNPNASGKKAEYMLERRITVKERIEREKQRMGEDQFEARGEMNRAQVISALTRMTQEWGRAVEGRELILGMMSMNTDDSIPADARWISVDSPTNVEKNRIISIGKDSALVSSKTLRNKLRVPGNWAYLEDNAENRSMFGPMAGHYVAGPVYTSILDYNNTDPVVDSQTFRASLVLWKKGKTVFSPVAHVNNVMGNMMLAYYYDLPIDNLQRALRIIWFETRGEKYQRANPLSREDHAMRKEMDAMGIRLAQSKTADYDIAAEEKLGDWVKLQTNKLANKHGVRGLTTFFTKLEGLAGKSNDIATDLYSNQDNVFRLATYMTHIQDHGTIRADGTVEESVKLEAARRAESAFVDYRITAPWVKAARETAFPFIAWPYRMIPLVAKTMLTKPWKAANTMMAISALNAVSYAILGGGDDEEEKERNLMPEWYQRGLSWMPWTPSSIRLPVGTGNDAYFLNLSRTIPLADVDSVGGNGTYSLITPGGPAFILAYALNGYDPFTGKELSTGAEDLSGFLESRAAYLGRALAPGVITAPVGAYQKAQTTGPLGYEHNFWVNLAKVMGLSTFQINKPEAAFYKDIQRKQTTRLFNSEIARNWRNELRQKEPDYESGYQAELELQQRMLERLQELAGGV